jgi:hypothetical protein
MVVIFRFGITNNGEIILVIFILIFFTATTHNNGGLPSADWVVVVIRTGSYSTAERTPKAHVWILAQPIIGAAQRVGPARLASMAATVAANIWSWS